MKEMIGSMGSAVAMRGQWGYATAKLAYPVTTHPWS